MRVNIHAHGFDLAPQLRSLVESRLLGELGSFSAHIQSVAAHLEARVARHNPETTSCEIVVGLRPSREVRVRAEDPKMEGAVDRAARSVRSAVERELSQSLPHPASLPVAEIWSPASRLEIRLDGNQISQQQREMLERPENHLRPVRLREYWRPPGVEDDAMPEELTREAA